MTRTQIGLKINQCLFIEGHLSCFFSAKLVCGAATQICIISSNMHFAKNFIYGFFERYCQINNHLMLFWEIYKLVKMVEWLMVWLVWFQYSWVGRAGQSTADLWDGIKWIFNKIVWPVEGGGSVWRICFKLQDHNFNFKIFIFLH